MCCRSKKKQKEKTEPLEQTIHQNSSNHHKLQLKAQDSPSKILPSNASIIIPKSKLIFPAYGFDQISINNAVFVPTVKANRFPNDTLERHEDYAVQTRLMKEPVLIADKSLLNYDLDSTDGGVSGNPVVDTFHYQSVLSHCFLHKDNTQPNYNKNTAYKNYKA